MACENVIFVKDKTDITKMKCIHTVATLSTKTL